MYLLGFGDVSGEHWLGMEKLNTLLDADCDHELRIDLISVNNEWAVAKYSHFHVGDASTDYTLSVSGYSSNSPIDPG